MLRLGAERDELRVVDDQIGAPTSARDLAEAVLQIATQLSRRDDAEACGTFHYAGEGATNWYCFAKTIFEMAGDSFAIKARIVPIKASEYPSVAHRPRNSCLDCTKIRNVYRIEPTPWQPALAIVLEDLRRGRAP
jgi:dTDP-4-dehydrorhamnose reductase